MLKRVLSLGLAGLLGCGDDTSTPSGAVGTLTFTSWGEEYIEQGIPAAEFADGFSVRYDKFLIVLGGISVADDEGNVAASDDKFYVIDHVEPGVKEIVKFEGLEAKAYPKVSYIVAGAARDQMVLVGSVSEADADMMASNGYHVYVEGTLTDGTGAEKTFRWSYDVPTLLDDCEGELDGKETVGAVVTEGGDDVIELTVHGDHFFYDDLQAADAVVRGQAIFDADADMDGEITQAELSAVSLIDLPADQYGTGGVDGVNDLGAFVSFLSRTLGHFRGEGECFINDP